MQFMSLNLSKKEDIWITGFNCTHNQIINHILSYIFSSSIIFFINCSKNGHCSSFFRKRTMVMFFLSLFSVES